MAKLNEIRRVLLDASCLLGIIKGENDMACLQSLLRAIDEGAIQLVESSAILAEVLPIHERDGEDEQASRSAILSLLESARVELVDVSAPVARKAAELRVTHGMKTWDAIHVATGVSANVDVIMARDGRFPYGHSVEGVLVSRPFDIDDDKLPFG